MRIKLIDYLKGYSILTIVLFHLLQNFNLSSLGQKLIVFGGSGTHVFILCSGFGLCLSQLNRPLGYLTFLKKRFLKIYIPYIIIVLLTALVPNVYENEDLGLAILSHVFLFKMFNETWTTSLGYHFWFISMILQFYLVFPFLYKIIIRYRFKSVLVALVISLLWSTVISLMGKSDLRVWNSFFLQYLWEFCLGMYVAIRVKENPSFLQIPSLKVLVPTFVVMSSLMLYMGLRGGILKVYNDVPALFSYLSLSLIIYLYVSKQAWLVSFFDFINNISYELYLVHMIIFIVVFRSLSNELPLVLVGMVALGLSFLVAFLYSKFLKNVVIKRL